MFRGKYLFFKRCEWCFWDRSSSIGCEAGPRTSWIIQHNWSVNTFLLSFYPFFTKKNVEMLMTTLTTAKNNQTQPRAMKCECICVARAPLLLLRSWVALSLKGWVALSLKGCLWVSLSEIGVNRTTKSPLFIGPESDHCLALSEWLFSKLDGLEWWQLLDDVATAA